MQTLREDVRELRCHRHVQDTDITDGNAFPHKVEVDLNMLYALVLNEVGKEIDSVDVVIVEGALRQRDVELLK
jgi:coenzyme F420-reducing hydrogenase gamma subunit